MRWRLQLFVLLVETQSVWPLGPKIALHSIESFLFQMKAALDLLAPLPGKWLGVKSGIRGFNKGGDDPGGRFLNVLGGVGSEAAGKAEALVALFKKHKAEWLENAVHLREETTHGSMFNRHVVLECSQRIQKVGVIGMDLKLEYKGKSLLGTIRKFDTGFKSLIAETIEPLKTPLPGEDNAG